MESEESEPIEIDITAMPDVVRLAHEVATSGRRCTLTENGAAVAVLAPARPRRRVRKPSPEVIQAALATAGSWAGLVDPDELKRHLREEQWDDRPPPRL